MQPRADPRPHPAPAPGWRTTSLCPNRRAQQGWSQAAELPLGHSKCPCSSTGCPAGAKQGCPRHGAPMPRCPCQDRV